MPKASLAQVKKADLIVFDLDGTLAESKSAMDAEMTKLFVELLNKTRVAVISGGKYGQFKKQLITSLRRVSKKGVAINLKNLFLFPTTSSAFYHYDRGWKLVYEHRLPADVRKQIKRAFKKAFKEIGYEHPEKIYGKLIEDRGTQVTFSALGQEIVSILGTKRGVAMKKAWREGPWPWKLLKAVQNHIPNGIEARLAGLTSIDVLRKGIDKAYGIQQIEEQLHVSRRVMVFIGDAIYPGGNDYAVVKAGVPYIKVSDVDETKKIIRAIL